MIDTGGDSGGVVKKEVVVIVVVVSSCDRALQHTFWLVVGLKTARCLYHMHQTLMFIFVSLKQTGKQTNTYPRPYF